MRSERSKGIVGILLMFLISGLLFSIFATKNNNVSVSIQLKLNKDILALAEPTVLTVEIMNNQNRDLLLHSDYMFGLELEPYPLSLYLITPEGVEWSYIGSRYQIDILRIPDPRDWLLVPPGKGVSYSMLATWTDFVPSKYQIALEKLPSGTYKLFANYELPEQNGLHGEIIYSDTVEFIFLPPLWEHIPVLIEMDSLRDYYLSGGARLKIAPKLQSIADSKTPYSEAAQASLSRLVGSAKGDPDSLAIEKAIFDELYPDSQFEVLLLQRQYLLLDLKDRVLERDSVEGIISKIQPNDARVLVRQGAIKHPAKLEDVR
jgi:hypothetical protein